MQGHRNFKAPLIHNSQITHLQKYSCSLRARQSQIGFKSSISYNIFKKYVYEDLVLLHVALSQAMLYTKGLQVFG